MARVFLAVQRGAFDVSKLVVVKQLRPEFASDQEFLEMFVDEARLSLRFNHPNVVHTYEVSAELPEYCLIMEYLEGRTLAQLLRRVGRQQMPLELHVWILSQVLAGLSYAHGLVDFDGTPLGVVHRDVSPTNVLITTSGEVKLLDFGIAKAVGAISSTRQGVVKGKLGYASPEQCMGRPADSRSDLYAVGVMLWEAIANRRRTNSTAPQLAALRARIDNAEPPIEAVVPDVPPALAAACRLALAHAPDARFATALDFQTALQEYLERSSAPNYQMAVAELVRSSFEADLAQERQTIELRMSSSIRTTTGAFAIRGGRRAGTTASPETPESSAAHPAAPEGSAADGGPREAMRRFILKRRWWVLAAGGAAAMLAALVFSRADHEPAPVASQPQPAKPAASLSAAPASGSLRATSVAVRIRVSPEDARLMLDGAEVANPYDAIVAADDREHEIVAELSGYKLETRRARFDRDVDLHLTLSKRVVWRSPPETGRQVAARPRNASTASPVLESTTPSESQPGQPRSGNAEPGEDLGNAGTARPRTIDEADPYSP